MITMVDVSGFVDSGLTTAYTGMIWVGVIGIILGLAAWVWWRRQFKYLVRLKVLKNGAFIYYEDVAREIHQEGSQYWKLRGLKELCGIPPSESISQNNKGQFVAEGYYSKDAGVIWAKDTMTREEFRKLEEELRQRRATGKTDGKTAVFFDTSGVHGKSTITKFQPLTTQERALQAGQVTKAMLRKGNSIWDMIWKIAPAILILIVFVLILVFWNDIAKPVITLSQQNIDIQKNNKEIMQQNLRFYTMLTGGKGNGTYVVQQIPEDERLFPQVVQ